ncbi:MAG: hypothetical protein HOU01_12375 [Streptomycetaceae bacterium]|jgi:hypothetical protein|nr:hypothetical protein [Streptomycetaceae bacterium]
MADVAALVAAGEVGGRITPGFVIVPAVMMVVGVLVTWNVGGLRDWLAGLFGERDTDGLERSPESRVLMARIMGGGFLGLGIVFMSGVVYIAIHG